MARKFVDLVRSYKQFETRFWPTPDNLMSFTPAIPLNWIKVKFERANRNKVPKTRGIYAFVVLGNHQSLPPHGFVMYIGQAGDSNSARTLNKRYGEYLREKKVNKRAGVHYMLSNWSTCIYFCYAEVPSPGINLKRLERSLNDSMIPPFSTNDFSAELKQAKWAF